MVKIDVRRDYYTDLGVSQRSDTDEIKKQFRKLAMRYHPDRNPGKEAEFNPKFQEIQAAHEVLSDPQQRLKYDTERLRAGYGMFYGPQNSTRRTSTSSYPAPTPGNAPTSKTGSSQRPAYQAPPSKGAQKYAPYKKAPSLWDGIFEDARAEAYRGFKEMKGDGIPGWSNFDPRTGRTGHCSTRSTPNAVPTAQSPRQPSAYEYVRDSQLPPSPRYFKTPNRRRPGFAPGYPGGDEPMARNVFTYASTSRADRSQQASPAFDSAPSPTPKKASAEPSFFPAHSQEFVAPEFERHSSRYATTGGEKTFLSNVGLGRSKTVRTSPKSPRTRPRTNPPSPSSPPSGRHHSASPKLKADKHPTFAYSTSSSDLDEDHPTSKPKVTPKSRLRQYQTFSESYSTRDWNPGSGEDFSSHPDFLNIQPEWTRGLFGAPRPHTYYDYSDYNADNEHYQGHNSDGTASQNHSRRDHYTAETAKQSQHETAEKVGESHRGDAKIPSSFFEESIPGKHPLNGEPKPRSHENINTSFSASDWHSTFQGSDFFVPTPSDKEQPIRSRTSPTRGRSATRQDRNPQSKTASSMNGSSEKQPPMQFAQPKPPYENWTPPKFDNGPQEANIYATRSPKKSSNSTPKRATAPKPVTVTTEAQEQEATVFDHSGDRFMKNAPKDPEAMDIDDEPPSKTDLPANQASEQPNGRGWRPEGHAPEKPGATPEPSSHSGNMTNGVHAKDDLFNLKNIKNMTPFTATNNSGINSLDDIHVNLPFESQPSNQNSSRRTARPRELEMPNPPKRPPRPDLVPASLGSQQMVLPRKAWERYVGEMRAYMREWNDFNRRMLRHFSTRQDATETGLSPRWINAVGNSTRLKLDGDDRNTNDADLASDLDNGDDILVPGRATGGFSAYLRTIEEESRMRVHWNVACDWHHVCIIELGEVREWIRNGGKVLD